MADRIVVFGATGYTGELIASRLVAQGARPVLAGRSESRLSALAERLGGLEWARADAMRQNTVFDLVGPDDVLVSTVGPFAKWGLPAARAAVAAGCTYIDTTGEPEFIRRLFTELDEPARRSGARLIPSLSYEFAAGSLAGRAGAGRGGRGRRAGRRRLLRARRRAELAVGRHARVAGRDRARRPLRVPRRRGAVGAVGGARALVRGGRARRARRSRSGGAEHYALPRRVRLGCARSTCTPGWFGPLSRAAAGGVAGRARSSSACRWRSRRCRFWGERAVSLVGRPGARARRRTCGRGSWRRRRRLRGRARDGESRGRRRVRLHGLAGGLGRAAAASRAPGCSGPVTRSGCGRWRPGRSARAERVLAPRARRRDGVARQPPHPRWAGSAGAHT